MDLSTTQEHESAAPNIRGKTDPAWEHFNESRALDGKIIYTCLYCQSQYKGGGINRMKYHLAGMKGQIAQCKKVPHDVRVQMQNFLKQANEKKIEAQEAHKHAYGDDTLPIDVDRDDVQKITSQPNKVVQVERKGKRTRVDGVENYFAPRTTLGSQPSLKSVFASKEAVAKADMALARFFYDTCIPFNTTQSAYYQLAVDAIAGIGPGYKAPTYYDMRVKLLGNCKKECSLLLEKYRSNWVDTGCTIMADGWTDNRQRSLINFLVYCPAGLSFVKSIDVSDAIKDAETLFKLFCEVVEWVGPANVVHMVTDNAANYMAAGKKLHDKYDNIYWSLCAAHCLNLILKDISSMPHVQSLASRASKVTIFVYNHHRFLAWLRKRPGWREIVRPGPTRFATTFLTLKSIHDHKHDLQAFITSKFFTSHKLSKTENGKAMTNIILDNKFWDECLVMVKIAGPLMRLLRIVDADEKPSLGYVYEGMHRARLGIKNMFMKRKRLYQPYTTIIKERWDKHLRRNLHAAAYFLNPAFLYEENFCDKLEIMSSVLDMLEIKSICGNGANAMKEIKLYRERLGSFARPSALASVNNIQPDEWWRLFGQSVPLLQKIAIRILSQTSSSSGCKRNWSLFDRIHTKIRNRLEHQRLNDLVFVRYNLRLKNMLLQKKRTYDPIDYECIDNVDFWIAEDDPSPELDYDEINSSIYEDDAIPIRVPTQDDEGETNDQETDATRVIDLESFGNIGESISNAAEDNPKGPN